MCLFEMCIKLVKPEKHYSYFHQIVILLILLSIPSVTTHAQLTISPVIIELTGYPGGLRTFTFTIGNIGQESLDCSIRVSAMAVAGGGLPYEVEDAPRSCKDWITVTPETFRLSSKDGRKIVCNIRVPRDTGGGYYAIISCLGTPPRTTDDAANQNGVGAGIQFSHRGLVPVLLTIPAPQMQAVIDAAEPVISRVQQASGYDFKLPVRNRGNVHARMTGTMEIRSEAEQLVDKFELVAGRGFILPGHERLFENKGSVNLPDGVYIIRARLEVQGSGRPMQNAFPFYVQDGTPQIAEITDELKEKLQKQSAGFIISPAEMLVSLQPGGRRSQAVELINLTRDIIRLRADLMQWYRLADGNDIISDSNELHNRSGLETIEMREKTIELRPLSRQRLPLMVTLPKQALGETYAAVTFNRTDIQLDDSAAGRTRRSTKIRIYARGTGDIIAEITKLEASRRPNGAVEMILRFNNTGDIGFVPEATFRILDEYDRAVGKVSPSVSPFLVQAGCEGMITAQWSRILDPGEYTVEVTFRPTQNKPPLVERTKFVVPKILKVDNDILEEQNNEQIQVRQ